MIRILKTYKDFVNENKISANITIPKDIEEIAKLFHNVGKDLFVVGGAVRDFLQGKTPHDFDIVTNALPDETKRILKGWNVSDEQGANFGVLRIFTDDEPAGHEIATYRKDISGGRDTKGDEDKVEIGNHITIDDDVLRRDLTINALFYDINKKEIVDLVGGVEDIKNNIIRCVGLPSDRFREDRLRILRCLRFAARTGGKIDPATSQAIKDDNRLRGISIKEDVSQERIHEEWNKVMEHAQSDIKIMERYIDLLTEYDMWVQMFPGMKITTNIKIEYLSNAIIFLDLLWKENIKKSRKILNTLKFPTSLINEMEFLQEYYIETYYIESIYRLAKLKDRYHIDDELLIDFVDHKHLELKLSKSFIRYCNDGFEVDGNDLMVQGFKGKDIEDEKQRREIERFKNKYLNR